MSSAAAAPPREKATTYPILGKIIADIALDDAGCQMPAARFQHWGRLLAAKYPQDDHPKLYQMLGGMSLEFAQLRAFAAVQLYALATLGLPVPVAEELFARSDFLQDAGRRADTVKLTPQRRPTNTGAAMMAPAPSGVSMRPAAAKSRKD